MGECRARGGKCFWGVSAELSELSAMVGLSAIGEASAIGEVSVRGEPRVKGEPSVSGKLGARGELCGLHASMLTGRMLLRNGLVW